MQVTFSGSADKETLPLSVQGAYFKGDFNRLESMFAVPEDGVLQHLAADSLILSWTNPADPKDMARRAYPYRGYRDIVRIRPQNTVAHTTWDQSFPDGRQWIISDAPGLVIQRNSNTGSCCSIAPHPVDSQNRDSLRLVGIVVEASRAGNGAYVFKTAVTLPPKAGAAIIPETATTSRRVGILRTP